MWRLLMVLTILFSVVLGTGSHVNAHADSLPGITVNDVTKARPTSGTTTFAFTITLEHPSNNTVYVSYYTTDGSARSSFDYQGVSGTATFAPTKTSATVNVTVNGSTLHTGNRYFNLYLNNPVSATLIHSRATGWIIDTTPQAYLNVSDATATQGAGVANTAVFNVTLTSPSANTVKVRYYTSNGSAVAGTDYTATSGTLSFPPGTTSQQVNVPVSGVGIWQGAKYFYLNIYNPVNAATEDSQGEGVILNSNHVAYVTPDDTAVTEPSSGTVTANVPVRVIPTSNFATTVSYYTSDSSAVAGTDYTTATGTLTIPANTSQVTVPITVKASGLTSSRFFYVSLNSPSPGASVLRSSATVTIAPTGYRQMTIGDAAVVSPANGTTTETFTVALSSASTTPVTVNYATADGSATAGTDYNAASGLVTFPAGSTVQTVSVTVKAHTSQFNDVSYNLNLSSASGATLERSSALGVIEAGAMMPVLSIASAAVTKPTSGTVNEAFTVSLSSASPNTVTVNYSTGNSSAVAGTDYVANNGALTFSPGTLKQTINVTVNGNTIAGSDLGYVVNLGSPANAQIAGPQAWGYIQNPNQNPTLSINNVSVYKPQSGTATAKLTATLSSSSPNTVSVTYGTANGTASSGSDYQATTGTLTFNPGTTSQTMSVPVTGNTLPTGDRYFYMNLGGSATNATIVSGQARVDIIDSSITPYLSVTSTAVQKPASGTANAVFTVNLSPTSPNTVSVHYSTSDGSAVAGTDYTSTTGTVSFAPGVGAMTVNVPVTASTIHTGDRYFFLRLDTPTNALTSNQYYNTATIIDPTVNPSIAIDDASVLKPSSGTTTMNFTVHVYPASPNTITVNYSTSDGSAVAGTDYAATNGVLTINPNVSSQQVSVTVMGAATSVPDRYFYLSLNTPVNGQLSRGSAYGQIIDTVAPTSGTSYFTIGDVGVARPNGGTATEQFTVHLFPAPTNTVTVNYTTADGSATAGNGDYVATRGTLSFASGVTSQTVDVTVNGSTFPAGDKYFYLQLGSNTGSTNIFRSQSYGFILNAQPDNRVWVGPDVTINRGDSGSQTMTFSVALSSPQQFPVQVDYTTNDGNISSPDGYVADAGTITFNPGQTTQTVSISVPGNPFFNGVQWFYLDIGTPVNTTTAQTREEGIVYNLDNFTISGKVIDQNGGLAGASVTRTGNNQPAVTVQTASDGSFSFPNTINGTYTITPALSNETFLPANAKVTVLGGSVAVPTFLGYAGTGITGMVADSSSKAVSGVTVTLSGGGLGGNVVTTSDSQGYYAFGNVANASGYNVAASGSGYTFNPASYTVNVSGTTVKNEDFVAVKPAYIIGRVITSTGAGDSGVTMTRSGGGAASTTVKTNSQGYYGFSANPATSAGVTYTITPSKTGATFTPASAPATVSTTVNATGVNFTQN